MFEYIRDHCVRADSMRLSEFLRAIRAAGFRITRTAAVAQLSREFTLSEVGGQTWIIGLSMRNNTADRLRQFIDENCIRADGLTCKLGSIVRGAVRCGLTRNQVIQLLERWGFTISSAAGTYVVRGLAFKEPEYA
jgi:hypothetical protein